MASGGGGGGGGWGNSPAGFASWGTGAGAHMPLYMEEPQADAPATDYTDNGGYYNTGGGGGGSYSAAPPPYTQRDIDSFNTQKSNIYGSAGDWANNYGAGLGGNITDFINGLRQQQQGIDEQGVQNELALKQGRTGVLGMVSRGIHSGGVMLSNRNAADSSASAALANAYGTIGRGQMNTLNNQHDLKQRGIDIAQQNFFTNAQAGARKIHDTEGQDIAGAVSQARDKLAALDAWAADKSLPDRIAVDQEKAAIEQDIRNRLGGYDAQLEGWHGVQPTSIDQRRSTAAELASKGQAADSPFEFSATAPTGFQSTPSSSDLPLYTVPKKKTP